MAITATTGGSLALVASVMLLGSTAAAQPCRALDVRNPSGNYIVPAVLGDIPYSDRFALDAYIQPGGGRRPAIVVIHGGGWTSGSRSAHVGQLLELLTRAGYHWFSVDYGLHGIARFEESLGDLRAALSFLRCRAKELGIAADELVLLGEDSGAHLAALLAAERPPGVRGAILLGGFYDLSSIPSVTSGLDADRIARGSPHRRVASGMPELLVIHGGADTEAPPEQARRFCEAAARNGGGCRFFEAPGASHRVENWWPSQWGYKQEITRWLSTIAPAPGTGKVPEAAGALRKGVVFSPRTGLTLDAWVPPSDTRREAVILVHGGGWEAGDKVTYVTPLFQPLAEAGLAWFSIDYRLTPAATHEEQLADLREAIQFVRDHAHDFSVDPARIVLIGESASAQMVTLLAAEDPSLAGVVSFYGVYDLPAMVTDASPRSLLARLFRRHVLDDEARALLRHHSPLYRAHGKMPPVLLVTGTADRLWPQAQAFAERLAALGTPPDLVVLEGAPHGMENWEGHPEWTVYKERVVQWIRGLRR